MIKAAGLGRCSIKDSLGDGSVTIFHKFDEEDIEAEAMISKEGKALLIADNILIVMELTRKCFCKSWSERVGLGGPLKSDLNKFDKISVHDSQSSSTWHQVTRFAQTHAQHGCCLMAEWSVVIFDP